MSLDSQDDGAGGSPFVPALVQGWADKFCLHLNRKRTGKDILMK